MSDSLPSLLITLAGVSTAAPLIAWICTYFLSRQSAALRHAIWVVAISAPTVALPILFFKVKIDVPIWPSQSYQSNEDTAQSGSKIIAKVPKLSRRAESTVLSPIIAAAAVNPNPYSLYLTLWLIGLIVVLTKMAIDRWRIALFVRSQCRAINVQEWRRIARLMPPCTSPQFPRIRIGPPKQIPFCFGILSPVIILPDLNGLTEEHLEICLKHELAHLNRKDLLWLFVNYISCAICWFNLFMWVGLKYIKAESELAADDQVIVGGVIPTAYGTSLLEIVRLCQGSVAPNLSISMISDAGEITNRVQRSLNRTIQRKAPSNGQLGGIASVIYFSLGSVLGIHLGQAQSSSTNSQSIPTSHTTAAIDYHTIHNIDYRDIRFISYSKSSEKDYYPYDNQFVIILPASFRAPVGTWIKFTSSKGFSIYVRYIGRGQALTLSFNVVKYFGVFKGTWQFVEPDKVKPGPWISTHDNAATFAQRANESKKFNYELDRAVEESHDFSLLRTLWEAQPPGVYYCSKVVYAISQDRPFAELDALVVQGEAVNPPQQEITPISVAVARQNISQLKWLFDHGAICTSSSADSPLAIAVRLGDVEVVRLLLSHGIRNINYIELIASSIDSNDHKAIIDLLAQNGVFKDCETKAYALWRVAERGDVYLLKTLLKEGYDPQDRHGIDNSGTTAIDEVRREMTTDPSLKPMLAILESPAPLQDH